MRILFVTDAWHPQVNGVVETLTNLSAALRDADVDVSFLTPEGFRSVPLPSYADIRLAITTYGKVRRRIEEAKADEIHIVTEGPLGMKARRYCVSNGIGFTSTYHTRFPEYLRARLPIPTALTYRWFRRFHNASRATLVATRSLADDLSARGFDNLKLWGRGVDCTRYHPRKRTDLGLPGPIFLSVGRVAVEKNLPAFLDLDLPGTKLVVGDGPDRERLARAYPDAVFVGAKFGAELERYYASSDVFVFPSRTDTFGMVLLEAAASGLPVAAYPVTGPADIFAEDEGAVLSEDLREACLAALSIPREVARAKARKHTWQACAEDFLRHLREASPAPEILQAA